MPHHSPTRPPKASAIFRPFSTPAQYPADQPHDHHPSDASSIPHPSLPESRHRHPTYHPTHHPTHHPTSRDAPIVHADTEHRHLIPDKPRLRRVPSSDASASGDDLDLSDPPLSSHSHSSGYAASLTNLSIPTALLSNNSASSSRNPSTRVARAHERNRALVNCEFDDDPLALPASQRADLGDDDSFSPDIVSGYHFNIPLAREGSIAQPIFSSMPDEDTDLPRKRGTVAQLSFRNEHISITDTVADRLVEHREIDTIAVQRVDLGYPDLGDDDDYTGESNSMKKQFEQMQRDLALRKLTREHIDQEHDHRDDAVYDDLDDIGDWVGNAAPAGADLTKRLARAVNTGLLLTDNGPGVVGNATTAANAALSNHQRAENKRRQNQGRDKLDRATVEQVLDPRTRMILFRLLSRNRLRTLDGCVSTGKEANVYFATAASDPSIGPDASGDYVPNPKLAAHDYTPDAGVAVKVFKTSILQFKDRERYVTGEFRFRRGGYQRGSNRKMVQQWAEKEFRNQIRLREAGIPAPVPLLLKPPILIMSFFGKEGWPAPRLKDASLSPSRLAKAYFRICAIMRRMFRVARLVHGDLSEYNMLYWKGDVVIIDVSQSVEDDHPLALEFLRRDCANVNDFFRRSHCESVLSVRELFDFVTGQHISDVKDEEEGTLNFLLDGACSRDMESMRLSRQDDEVFMKSHIPRTLKEMELRDQQFGPRPSQPPEQSLFAKLTGLTLTQKRERSVSRPKSTSLSDGGNTGQNEKDNANDLDQAVAKKGIESSGKPEEPDLASPVEEPPTFRTLPQQENQQMSSSSSCTSQGSSKRVGEELESSKVEVESGSMEKNDVEEHAVEETLSPSNDADATDQELNDGTFDPNGDSDTSSSDEWVREPRQEASDPFMGLSKKEWKKHVKIEARERRENKTPKHVKKRKELLAKRRRGNK